MMMHANTRACEEGKRREKAVTCDSAVQWRSGGRERTTESLIKQFRSIEEAEQSMHFGLEHPVQNDEFQTVSDQTLFYAHLD